LVTLKECQSTKCIFACIQLLLLRLVELAVFIAYPFLLHHQLCSRSFDEKSRKTQAKKNYSHGLLPDFIRNIGCF
jgi:hypothetical protein